MHSNFFFRPSFCCFMILFGCLFYSIVCIRYVSLKVHSCFFGYLLMVTNRVICDLFGNDLTHFVCILKIFPSQPLFFSIFLCHLWVTLHKCALLGYFNLRPLHEIPWELLFPQCTLPWILLREDLHLLWGPFNLVCSLLG